MLSLGPGVMRLTAIRCYPQLSSQRMFEKNNSGPTQHSLAQHRKKINSIIVKKQIPSGSGVE
eukprot:2636626-Amphidinium_carterae.1